MNLFFKFLLSLVWTLSLSSAFSAESIGSPLVGNSYSQFIPTEMGYQIPLPNGKWEVTAIRIREQPIVNDNTTKHLVLKNHDVNAVIPYMVVRYATVIRGTKWSGNCDRIPKVMFAYSMHGTNRNQLFQKCQMFWAEVLPRAHWENNDEWWKELSKGVESASPELKKELFVETFLNLSKWGGDFVYINLFARPSLSGTSARAIEKSARDGEPSAWLTAFKDWSADYMQAIESSVFNKKPISIAAFKPPTVGSKLTEIAIDATNMTGNPKIGVPPTNNSSESTTSADQNRAKETARLAEALRNKEEQERLQAELKSREERLAAEARAREELARKAQEQAVENQRLLAEVARLKAEAEKNRPKLELTSHRKALVIGNNNYKFVSTLTTATEDAKSIADNLAKVGYKVTLKLDTSEREMRAAIRNFSSQVEGGDEVAFYFAGHGVQIGSANYLIPVDVNGESEAQIRDEAVALQRILDDMTERKAKFTLAVIDACRDNPFKMAGRNIGSGLRGLAPTSAATGQMVIFSAGAGQKALDSLGPNDTSKNGVFTRVFVKQMQKPAIPIDKILKDTRSEVVSLAKSIGHEQVPVPAIYDQVIGEFFFKR